MAQCSVYLVIFVVHTQVGPSHDQSICTRLGNIRKEFYGMSVMLYGYSCIALLRILYSSVLLNLFKAVFKLLSRVHILLDSRGIFAETLK